MGVLNPLATPKKAPPTPTPVYPCLVQPPGNPKGSVQRCFQRISKGVCENLLPPSRNAMRIIGDSQQFVVYLQEI